MADGGNGEDFNSVFRAFLVGFCKVVGAISIFVEPRVFVRFAVRRILVFVTCFKPERSSPVRSVAKIVMAAAGIPIPRVLTYLDCVPGSEFGFGFGEGCVIAEETIKMTLHEPVEEKVCVNSVQKCLRLFLNKTGERRVKNAFMLAYCSTRQSHC